MARLIWNLLHALIILFTSNSIATQDVALGINTYSKETRGSTPSRTNSFITLISEGVFVDKTLLIDAIVSDPGTVSIITCPTGWGKTTNLDMLRMFFGIQVHANGSRILPVSATPNYRLFKEGNYQSDSINVKLEKPLLISNEKYRSLFDEHLGQHPLVYLNFGIGIFTNESGRNGVLTEIIAKAFYDHKYMAEIIGNRSDGGDVEKEKFIKYLNAKENEDNTPKGILFLCQQLSIHYKKKVIILIDGFKRLLDELKPQQGEEFFLHTLTNNEYLKKSILTDILPQEVSEFNNSCYHHFQANTVFRRFYGFTTEEMNLLYNHHQIPTADQMKMQYWYGGYKPRVSNGVEIFNPWSARNYIISRQWRSHWTEMNLDDHLRKIFQSPILQYAMSRFVIGKDYDYETKTEFPIRNLLSINKPCNAMEYLITTGYLTTKKIGEQTYESTSMATLKIPNFEIAVHFRQSIADNLNYIFDTQLAEVLKETSSIWERFSVNDELMSRELEINMQKCLKQLSEYLKKPHILYLEKGSEVGSLIHSLVMSMISSQELHFIGWQFDDLSKGAKYPDIVISCKSRGFVINIPSAKGTNSAINQVWRYDKLLKKYAEFYQWKDIKYVDCKISLPYKRVKIVSVIEPVGSKKAKQ